MYQFGISVKEERGGGGRGHEKNGHERTSSKEGGIFKKMMAVRMALADATEIGIMLQKMAIEGSDTHAHTQSSQSVSHRRTDGRTNE